jgi:hypothetical protein
VGLKTNINNAMTDFFTHGTGDKATPPTEEQKIKIEKFAKDMEKAIEKFILDQVFTITKMKAYVEVEKIATTGNLNLKTVNKKVEVQGTGNNGAPVKSSGFNQEGIGNEPLNMTKNKSKHGVSLDAFGHAYLASVPNTPIKSDTSSQNGSFLHEFSEVRLDPERVKGKG